MSAKEQLLDFISSLTQEEVELILANINPIAEAAAAMAAARAAAPVQAAEAVAG